MSMETGKEVLMQILNAQCKTISAVFSHEVCGNCFRIYQSASIHPASVQHQWDLI